MEETIPKKTAAQEVHNHLNKSRFTLLLSIGGFFVVVLCTSFSMIAGGVAACVLTGINAFALYKTLSEMRYLEAQYQIAAPKPIFKNLNYGNLNR